MFGGDELVACLRAQVFDVINEEGVGEGMLSEENYLGASSGEAFCYFGAYA